MLADWTHIPGFCPWDLERLEVRGGWGPGWRRVPQPRAALRELCLAYLVGQEAEMAQPMEAVRRDVQHQPP